MALVREPDFIFEQINEPFKRLVSMRDYEGRSWNCVYADNHTSLPLLEGLTEVYKSGVRRSEKEIAVSVWSDRGVPSLRYFDISFDRIANANNSIYGVLIQLVDVTSDVENRKVLALKEAVIRESQNKLIETLRDLPIAVAILEGPEHRFLFVNQHHIDHFGNSSALVGKTLLEATAGYVKTNIPSIVDEVYKTGQPFFSDEFPIQVTFSNQVTQDRVFKLSFQPLRSLKNEVSGIVFSAVDITSVVRSREELATKNQLLFNTQRLLAEATKVAKVGFFEWDLIQNSVILSTQMQADWGSKSGVPVDVLLNFILKEDRPRVERQISQAIDTGHHFYAEYRIRRPGASELIWIEAQGAVSYNKKGEPESFIGTSINITDRKNSENEVQAVANAIPQMAWIADTTGQIHWFNQRWYDYTGTTLEEMKGWGWKRVLSPDHYDRIRKHYEECWEKGVDWEDVFPIKASNAEYRWFLSKASPIRDENGRILKWFGTNTDITEQRENESTLTRLASVVESSRDFIGMSDPQFNPIFVNGGGRALTGFENRDVTKVAIADFFPSFEVPRLKSEVIPTLLKNGYWEGELKFRHFETGALIPVLYNIFPIIDRQGINIGYATVTKDISEQKKLEARLEDSKDAAEKANSAKTVFLANMSHEIRSPLGAIMGFSDLMKSSDITKDELTNFTSIIDRNSSHVLRIIDDILDLSKVEAGKMTIERVEFSLPDILADFISLMGLKARDKGIAFELKTPEPIPECIISDPTRLRQILTNAVGNAIKFTDRGRVEMTATYSDTYLSFSVQDTGVGLTVEQSARLFQAFEQADTSTTRKFGGTGLGLVLTRKLAEAMKGSFYLESSVFGVGSTFVAKVKIEVKKGSRMVESSSIGRTMPLHKAIQPSRPLAGISVLVIDDSPDNRALFDIMLTKLGAKILTARDGREGVDLALREKFDVVLCDIQMPRLDGYEAVAELKSHGYSTPVIALTAHAMKEEKDRALKAGFSGFLAKPVQREDLIERLIEYSTD